MRRKNTRFLIFDSWDGMGGKSEYMNGNIGEHEEGYKYCYSKT